MRVMSGTFAYVRDLECREVRWEAEGEFWVVG